MTEITRTIGGESPRFGYTTREVLELHSKQHGKGQVVCYECANLIVVDERVHSIMVVDQDTMQQVEIGPGWLTRQFLKYVLDINIPDDVEIMFSEDAGAVKAPHYWVEMNKEFLSALKRWDALVVQKNWQYDSSWQTLGEVIPVADFIDKLARLDAAVRHGATVKWDPDKKREMQFDMLVRNLMILAWEGANFKDDDDDRQGS